MKTVIIGSVFGLVLLGFGALGNIDLVRATVNPNGEAGQQFKEDLREMSFGCPRYRKEMVAVYADHKLTNAETYYLRRLVEQAEAENEAVEAHAVDIMTRNNLEVLTPNPHIVKLNTPMACKTYGQSRYNSRRIRYYFHTGA